jgi:hypothetical protein
MAVSVPAGDGWKVRLLHSIIKWNAVATGMRNRIVPG